MPDLRHIRTFTQLVRYLEDELGWPLDGYGVDDLTFVYEADELGLKPVDAAKVKKIRQLRPLDSKQPWGIFFIEFDRKKLPVVVLRRILSHLVVKKRASANKADRAAWSAEDLLFISAFGAEDEDGREITFAHFHQEDGDLPTLRVLGWDGGDTPLKFEHLEKTLKERLHWPDAKESLDAWRARWAGVFRHRVGHIINTSDMLAEAMAELAKRIRDAAKTLIDRETEKGPLRKLHEAFKTHLIHDLTEEGFADTYAQTITYGLLTAAISRTEMSAGKHGTALVASNVTDMVPVTNPFLKEMLQTFLQVGGRKGGIDFDELGVQDVVELLRGNETDLPAILSDFNNKTRGEDPVLHFYEHFLSAYNKQLKIQRGVFYTPQPVVSYIVRSAHELLQTEFGLADGLADTTTWGEFIQKSKINNPQSEIKLPPLTDEPGEKRTISPDEPFVQILDPATGTATFLVEVIEVIHKHLKTLWKTGGAAAMPNIQNPTSNIQNWSDYWNEYVPKALLPRLHAFELMMAPYAIAHMKIGLKLAETGYRFGTEERARIYLTNALEPWQKQLPLIGFDALAHEAAAVNEIKRHKRFTVVIGNPPYSGHSLNNSDWISHLVDDYYSVNGEPLGEQTSKWLQDDYVKFYRLAQNATDISKVGIVGYITNHGYIRNPTFRGMRFSLSRAFPLIRILDLHGSLTKKEKSPDGTADENVFEIQAGVAVGLFSRSSSEDCLVQHSDVFGLRESKYTWLLANSVGTSTWSSQRPAAPHFVFYPQDSGLLAEYNIYTKITDDLPLNGVGMTTARDHVVIDFDRMSLLERAKTFRDSKESNEQLCSEMGIPLKKGWDINSSRRLIQKEKDLGQFVHPVIYRPFDRRLIFYHDSLVWRTVKNVMRHLIKGDNLALLVKRQSKREPFSYIFCAKGLMESCVFESAYANVSILPLFVSEGDDSSSSLFKRTESRVPNFSSKFLRELARAIGVSQVKPYNLPRGLTPEDIFHYAYAVFHSPGYRSRYAEFLKIDFPRLPLTGNLELFRALARLGGELTALHLLESPKLAQPITEFIWGAHAPSRVVSGALAGNISPSADPTANHVTRSAESSSARARTTAREGACAPLVTRIGWSDNTVWLDAPATKKGALQAPGTSGFRGVPEAVWNFHIGGYQVCEKWLKDRKGRTLTDEDIAHYHKIVISLSETIRLMAEIDQVIESHGGWPGAFAADVK
jgi:hypothetical protein